MSLALRRLTLVGGAAACLLAAASQPVFAAALPQARSHEAPLPALPNFDIPYTKTVLNNGLTLIVHEDRSAPIVAVNIWYHVGSKHEPKGRSGFAHLFEHLMFLGSENSRMHYLTAAEALGATELNGTTDKDRTNYFQNVPTSALDSVLWLESDRMGHFQGAMNIGLVDEQRGVVQNEKRMRENQPYGRIWDLITAATYPEDHPYGHTVIGSMDDLNAATLDDVKNWFGAYYGPSNAVIVLAGDISPEEAKAKVEHYFGDIPPGPPVDQPRRMIAKMQGAQREVMYDRVGQPRLYKVWNVPPIGEADTTYLDILSLALTSGRTSRLHKRLVFDDQVATEVSSTVSEGGLGSQFMLTVTAKPGQDLAAIEAVVDEEISRLLRDGPTLSELERVRTARGAGFIRGLERIGGFGGKSDILARSQTFAGDPGAWKTSYETLLAATPDQVRAAGSRWLSDGSYSLEVLPFGDYQAAATGADRSKMPAPAEVAKAVFPDIQNFTLSNGMPVKFIQRQGSPILSMRLQFNAGGATDRAENLGLANLTATSLINGTKTLDALAISERTQLLGASIGSSVSGDTSSLTLSAISSRLEPSVALFADIVRNPAFRSEDLERSRARQISNIQQAARSPDSIASAVMNQAGFGRDHPYGRPLSGLEDTVKGLSQADVQAHHATWFRPDNAILLVVGDATPEALKASLEKGFGDWRAPATPKPQKAAPSVLPAPTAPRVLIVDRAGAQSTIMVARMTGPQDTRTQPAIDVGEGVFGGIFNSRLNLNLREDKQWAYGAHTGLTAAIGPRLFYVWTAVQSDKTAESLQELQKEWRDVVGSRPLTDAEVALARSSIVLGMAGRWATNGAVLGELSSMVTTGLPETYFDDYGARVSAITAGQATATLREVLDKEPLIWVVVGDRAKIEPKIRALNLGEVQVVDANGRPVN